MNAAAWLCACLLALGAEAAPAGKPKAPKGPEGSALPSFSASTTPVSVAEILKRFEELEAQTTSLRADFSQSVRFEEGPAQSVVGTVEYLRPSRLRIEHLRPSRQSVVMDGANLWVHRHETNQVLQSRLEDWKRSEPWASNLLDFGSYSRLFKRYDVLVDSVSAPAAGGHRSVVLRLKPREAGARFTLTLRLSTRDYFPGEAELEAGRAAISTRFSAVRLNPAFPEGHFRFTPPSDADVFHNVKPPSP